MPFDSKYGFVPYTFEQAMQIILEEINKGYASSMTYQEFKATNVFAVTYPIVYGILKLQNQYAPFWQTLQKNIKEANEKILSPIITENSMIEDFESIDWRISFRRKVNPASLFSAIYNICENALNSGIPPTADEILHIRDSLATIRKSAGVVCVAVKADALHPQTPIEIAERISKHCPVGSWFDGDIEQTLHYLSGQPYDVRWSEAIEAPLTLKLDIILSKDSNVVVSSPEDIAKICLKNIRELYRIGQDFEPEKYFEINRDAPYAARIDLYWQDPVSGMWKDAIIPSTDYRLEYQCDLPLANITFY